MNGNDEIIFSGAYKDFSLNVRYDLTGKSPGEVASVLGEIRSNIEPFAYKFSGIDTKAIDKMADIKGNGIKAVCEFLDNTPLKSIKESLSKACARPELMDVAESYLLNRLFDRAKVRFKANTPEPSIKPEVEEPGDAIAFIAKYKEWIAIKKLGLENVQEYEVSGLLSGVNYTIVNKAFDFMGEKTDPAIAESVSKGRRRSFGNISLCLRDLAQKIGSGEPDPYTLIRVLDNIGYKPYASPDMLTKAYPDIKPPKVRGRKPKG